VVRGTYYGLFICYVSHLFVGAPLDVFAYLWVPNVSNEDNTLQKKSI